jgi:hypothetical protein
LEFLKIQLDGSALYFMLMTPFAHAALADNQKTATTTVSQKSWNSSFHFLGTILAQCCHNYSQSCLGGWNHN